MGIIYDPMRYHPGMEEISSDVLEKTLENFICLSQKKYNENDVLQVLSKKNRDILDYPILLSEVAEKFLDHMAIISQKETRNWFGNAVQLFTPLYISNYCENSCNYCGFSTTQTIQRAKLSEDEIRLEVEKTSSTGLREVLILTGECRKQADLSYIGTAISIAKKYFPVIGVEIYPLNTEEYHFLRTCGVDFVSVYQETYDLNVYDNAHPNGAKRCFPYRFYAQERALSAGMRGVAFGALLGLGDARKDALAMGLHAFFTQKKFPAAEISFSFPRIRPFSDKKWNNYVRERTLLQIIMATRLVFPYSGITISTRERPDFRDHVVQIAATKLSAGVSVGVGGHSTQKGDPQFDICDKRSVSEIKTMLKKQNLQPIFQDYISDI